jgi:hypothetical protein
MSCRYGIDSARVSTHLVHDIVRSVTIEGQCCYDIDSHLLLPCSHWKPLDYEHE